MGYEVWADVMRLHGGADWSREMERALRDRTVKHLVVCRPLSMERDGVRNEIEIAAQLRARLNDPHFTIPLRLENFDPHFRIAHLQYVDFKKSWADGLAELVELFVNTYKVPRRDGRPMQVWLGAQTAGSTRLVQKREPLVSNWLRFRSLPEAIYYCVPPSGLPLQQFQNKAVHIWPIAPFGEGVVTFARPGVDGTLAPNVPAQVRFEASLREIRKVGWPDLGIDAYEAKRLFSDLGNQAFEAFLQQRGLKAFAGSGNRLAWWGDIKTAPLTKIRFDWPNRKGRRQIIGVSDKRKVHWHYAVSGQVRSGPVQHLRLSARLIFSGNGLDPLTDAKQMHRLRRSFAKSWRNARWRDMLSAFLWWVSSGANQIKIDVAHRQSIVLALPSAEFTAPISVVHGNEEPGDDDDPDIDDGEWDEGDDDADEQSAAIT